MTEQQFEDLLRQTLRPEIDPNDTTFSYSPSEKGHIMNMTKAIKKVVVVLAAVLALATTASAAGFMNIKSLASTSSRGYLSESYKDMDKAMKKAGFSIDAVEKFENGYVFLNVNVEDVGAYDEHGKEQFTYKELMVRYKNPSGKMLSLFTSPALEESPQDDRQPDQSRMIGEIQVDYQLDHYKFVPEDYKLTPEDEAMLKKPGYFLSYGSDEVSEQNNHSISWVKDGIRYHILDSGAQETVDTLFAMAEELIEAEE